MRTPARFLATTSLSALCLLGLPSAAHAQSAPSPSDLARPSPNQANIPEEKLNAAAAAIDRTTTVRQTYQRQIAQAAPADRERIADEADKALEKAVTEQGLSLDEYNSIIETARADPVVREKLLRRLSTPQE